MKARPYQQQAIDRAWEIFQTKQSVLAVLATGLGKTILFSHAAKRMHAETGKRILVIAHREELITQAVDKIYRATGLECDIEMADNYAKTMFASPVVVATVQTLSKLHRMERFNPKDFALIVTDEAHRATAKTYRKVYKYFLEGNPDCKHLGVTATPSRADEEALGQVFDDVAVDYGIYEGIQDGYLVDVDQKVVEVVGMDLSNCRTKLGDLATTDLNAILEHEEIMHAMVVPVLEIAGNKKTLFFASSCEQAKGIKEIFNRYDPDSTEYVDGKTPKDVRRDIIRAYYQGDIRRLVNVGIFTEGFDDPGVEVIANGRPTKSLTLYTQIFGRMTRPAEEVASLLNDYEDAAERRALIANSCKPSALMIDLVGNAGRHKLCTAVDILGGNYSDEVIELAYETAKANGRPENVMTELQRAEAELKRRERERQEAAARERIQFNAQWFAKDVSPFDALDITAVRIPGYMPKKPMTDKQRQLLERYGLPNLDQVKNTRHASQLIEAVKAKKLQTPASEKQVKCLRRNGIDPTGMTFTKANKIISAIAENGWKMNDQIRELVKEAS